MTGLPKLPGLSFNDCMASKFHLSQTLKYLRGYRYPRLNCPGIGCRQLDSDSVEFREKLDALRFDPSLTYGRCKTGQIAAFRPHYALYDQKCLTFRAFFKQSVVESADEHYRIRIVNIIYFLEDNTITVVEPKTPNSGIDQGRLVQRGRHKKNDNECWHWKDLGIGKDIAINGIVYHTVDCDLFTREYMASEGLTMGDAEQMPQDPYTQNRLMAVASLRSGGGAKTPSSAADDKFRRFLEYDGKILKFKAFWDERDTEFGEMRKYEILYFLADDTIAVKEVHVKNSGRDPFPQLLRKTKLPKLWTDRPVTFPSINLEISDEEVSEFYQPKDLRVGETIFVLGRKMLLHDCDTFTRNYYKKVLGIDQPEPPPIPITTTNQNQQSGGGEFSSLSMGAKKERKDVVRQVLNANKFLRYEMRMENVHPEDSGRKFILFYSLGDGTCKIHEVQEKNSGIIGGKYLRSTRLEKPSVTGTPANMDGFIGGGEEGKSGVEYYEPSDFYIGGQISVFRQRFEITGADLYVYRYIEANPERFPCELIENIRNYMCKMGFLKEDIAGEIEMIRKVEKKEARDAVGAELEFQKTEMENCLERFGIQQIPEENVEKLSPNLAEICAEKQRQTPVRSEPQNIPYGIQPVNFTCNYPTNVLPEKYLECKTEEEKKFKASEYDTPEEKIRKYYDNILRQQREICAKDK